MTNNSRGIEKSYRYTPSVMSKLSFLPQSKPDSPYLRKTNGRSSITISALKGQWAYGTTPRMFLIYVRSLIKNGSECVDTQNHIVYLDKTYHAFCKSVGLPYAGSDRERVLSMVENLASTAITLENWSLDGFKTISSFLVAKSAGLNYGKNDMEKSYIEFSPEMWMLLTESCVPLNPSILAHLKSDALALDIYQWLAFRANGTKYETQVSWEALRAQFKYDEYPMRGFKRKFRTALSKIQKVWPEIKAQLDADGLTIYPCVSSIHSTGNVIESSNVVEDAGSGTILEETPCEESSQVETVPTGKDLSKDSSFNPF